MSQYRTKDGDVLDAICARYYPGQTGATEVVLDANPNLADQGAILPSGIVVELPEIAQATQTNTITLWS